VRSGKIGEINSNFEIRISKLVPHPPSVDLDGTGCLDPIGCAGHAKTDESIKSLLSRLRDIETRLVVVVQMGNKKLNGAAIASVMKGDLGIRESGDG
jgi:hypothetical protein